MTEKALQKVGPTIDLPVLVDKEEVMEIMQENFEGMDGQGIEFERIKVPSSGSLFWEITDEKGEVATTKELKGILLDYHNVNAYWPLTEDDEKNVPPQCSSKDGKRGDGEPGGSCDACEFNQWQTDPKGGKGKACKNMRRIALLQEGKILPVVISLPPTSKNNIDPYIVSLTSSMTRLTGVETVMYLEKDKNDKGDEYSVVKFKPGTKLDKSEARALKQYANQIKPHIRKVDIEAVDYNATDEAAAASDPDNQAY